MPPNTVLGEEDNAWVNRLAGKLHLVWADSAGADAALRSQYVREEIEREFSSVSAPNYKRLMGALLSRFPTGGQEVRIGKADDVGPAPPPLAAPPPPPLSPSELLAQFLASVKDAPREQRMKLASQLAESEFGEFYGTLIDVPVSDENRKVLGISAGLQPKLDRILPLASQLLDVICRIHEDAKRTLGELAPASQVLRKQEKEDARKAAGRFLAGEIDTLPAQFAAGPGSFPRFFKAMFAAMLGGGQTFENAYKKKFKPDRIMAVVDAQGHAFMSNKEANYWQQYQRLADDYAKEGVIQREMREHLGVYVDRADAGGGR